MAELRPFDSMPLLNAAAVLLLGAEESWRERLAQVLLQEPKSFEVKIHMAAGLPMPSDPHRPRFHLVVVLVSLHNPAGLSVAQRDLQYLDPHFFLGRACFVAAAEGSQRPRALEEAAVRKMADTYRSPLLFAHMESEESVQSTGERLLYLLRVCAGMVPGLSALYLTSFTKSSLCWD